jgi:hypothetical protein
VNGSKSGQDENIKRQLTNSNTPNELGKWPSDIDFVLKPGVIMMPARDEMSRFGEGEPKQLTKRESAPVNGKQLARPLYPRLPCSRLRMFLLYLPSSDRRASGLEGRSPTVTPST